MATAERGSRVITCKHTGTVYDTPSWIKEIGLAQFCRGAVFRP